MNFWCWEVSSMELRKCKNCGAFINSDEDFCSACSNILSYNRTILKDYFDKSNTANFDSVVTVSDHTGVSPTIVQNYMIENNYIDSANLENTSFASLPF